MRHCPSTTRTERVIGYISNALRVYIWAWGSVVVKALRYYSDGPWSPVASLGIFSMVPPTEPQPLKVSTRWPVCLAGELPPL